MRKTLTLLFVCGMIISMQAQKSLTLTVDRNAFRAGDELQKQQVVFQDPGSSGRNLVWDFRHLQVINDEYTLRFFIPDSAYMHIICGMEHRTRYYFSLVNDSLWAIGFQNATTFMEYTKPELRMVFPFTFGNELHSYFEGAGEYGRRLHLGVRGTTHVEADAEGELLLPGGTVAGALRVRTRRHYTETRISPSPLNPPQGDFVHFFQHSRERRARVEEDNLEIILDTYSWYAQGMRYPVFQSIRTSISSNGADTTVFETSFYFSPIEQRAQTENSSPFGGSPEGEGGEGASAIFTQVSLLPNPVVDMLHINYKLTRDARIRFSLHNNLGVPMIETTTIHQSAGYHQVPVNMTGFITGVYTLYVHVDDMIMSLNVVKR